MDLHEPFGHLPPKLWAKERSKVKLALRPLKVGNRPNSEVCKRIATWLWKALEESYKIASELILIRGLSKKLWMPKVPRVQLETVSGLLLGSPENKAIWMRVPLSNTENTIWGKVVASLESGPW